MADLVEAVIREADAEKRARKGGAKQEGMSQHSLSTAGSPEWQFQR